MRWIYGALIILCCGSTYSQEAQPEDGIYVIPIMEGCMEAALDEVRFLAERGKIKYKVRKEIFWKPYLPKFTGYLEIQEFDNEVRGISKYLGQNIYGKCMPSVPIVSESSDSRAIHIIEEFLRNPSLKKYREKYIIVKDDKIYMYPILKEDEKSITPNQAPKPTQ